MFTHGQLAQFHSQNGSTVLKYISASSSLQGKTLLSLNLKNNVYAHCFMDLQYYNDLNFGT